MNKLLLRGVIYSKAFPHFRSKHVDLMDCWTKVAFSLNKHLDNLSSIIKSLDVNEHFLCSTINSMSFTSGQITWKIVNNNFKQTLKIPPSVYIDAYECAGWGYALRYHINQYTPSPALLISILDIDFFDLKFWIESPHWGKSGFGITTILLEKLRAEDDVCVITDCAKGVSPVTEFAFSIKSIAKNNPQCKIAVPFFAASARTILDKTLEKFEKLPDRHHIWGHCFGSDPWISIIESLLTNDDLHDKELLACSYALNCYFAIAKLHISKDIIFKFIDINQ